MQTLVAYLEMFNETHPGTDAGEERVSELAKKKGGGWREGDPKRASAGKGLKITQWI